MPSRSGRNFDSFLYRLKTSKLAFQKFMDNCNHWLTMHSSSLELLLRVREVERMAAEAELGWAVARLGVHDRKLADLQEHAFGENLLSGRRIDILQAQLALAALPRMRQQSAELCAEQEVRRKNALKARQRAEVAETLLAHQKRRYRCEAERREELERDDLVVRRRLARPLQEDST